MWSTEPSALSPPPGLSNSSISTKIPSIVAPEGIENPKFVALR